MASANSARVFPASDTVALAFLKEARSGLALSVANLARS